MRLSSLSLFASFSLPSNPSPLSFPALSYMQLVYIQDPKLEARMEELLRMLEESEAENDRLRSQMTVIAGEESYYEDENDVLGPLAGEGSSKSVKFGQTPLGGGSGKGSGVSGKLSMSARPRLSYLTSRPERSDTTYSEWDEGPGNGRDPTLRPSVTTHV